MTSWIRLDYFWSCKLEANLCLEKCFSDVQSPQKHNEAPLKCHGTQEPEIFNKTQLCTHLCHQLHMTMSMWISDLRLSNLGLLSQPIKMFLAARNITHSPTHFTLSHIETNIWLKTIFYFHLNIKYDKGSWTVVSYWFSPDTLSDDTHGEFSKHRSIDYAGNSLPSWGEYAGRTSYIQFLSFVQVGHHLSILLCISYLLPDW